MESQNIVTEESVFLLLGDYVRSTEKKTTCDDLVIISNDFPLFMQQEYWVRVLTHWFAQSMYCPVWEVV